MKYALTVPQGTVVMPEDAEIIGIGEQYGALHLFALGTVGGPMKMFNIHAFPTATPLSRDDLFHIGSLYVQNYGTEYHFFVQMDQAFS